MPIKKSTKEPVIINNNLPNTWADNIELFIREDNLCFLRFSTNLPEGPVEQGRVLINNTLLKNFIQNASEMLDKLKKK